MSSLADICTVAKVQAALPANGTLLGINLLPSTVTANAVYNASSSSSFMKRDDAGSTYCNVTVSYQHTGTSDNVVLWYTFPAPDAFANRLYMAGGAGYTLSTNDPTGGLEYGAVSGSSDVGYGGFDSVTLDEVVLNGNGSINWDNVNMFSFQAWGETTMVGQALTTALYGLGDSKLYTYFEGCSDGGREAMSQAQRYGELYDGIVAGAPAFHHAQQQVNHLTSAVTELVQGYVAPPCEMQKIANATIAACDPLDGRVDGVVSRSDLCRLHFDLDSLLGEAYYCAAQESSSLGFGFSKRQAGSSTSSYVPAQSGNVTAEAIKLAKRLYDGLLNSNGEQVFYGWQTATAFEDAAPTWDNDTESWEVSPPSTGGTFVTKFVERVEIDNLATLDGVTYDQLYTWMHAGFEAYYSSLQTGFADLTSLQAHGGKLLHFHGESDPSVPPPSSVRYYEAVRNAMYPDSSPNNAPELRDFYQFYFVPGAAHCGTNQYQPGPYPADNMQTLINWVESGVKPERLNATVTTGTFEGEVQRLCQWPTRPIWNSNTTNSFDCVYDQASYESWMWDLNAWKIPIY